MAAAKELFPVVFTRFSHLSENRGNSMVAEGNVLVGSFGGGKRIGCELNELFLCDSVGIEL